MSSARVWGRRWQSHGDAEAAGGARREREGPVVCLGDALDDGQAEADTCVVGAYALGATPERRDQRGDQLWSELLAGVLDGKHRPLAVDVGGDPHGAAFG